MNAVANWTISLDVSTLFIVASGVSGSLGLFLLLAWVQDRMRALAWWGCAYLIGGFAVSIWNIESLISPPLPAGFANALMFVSCGMIWTASRLFHGRPVLWGGFTAGATLWLTANLFPAFRDWTMAQIVLSSLIVASYTFLTSAELWHERRRQPLRRWPAVLVPMLHGAVFLIPIPLASLLPSASGPANIASGWIAIFVFGAVLYAVGTAFIGLAVAKERAVRIYKDAAMTDELTGFLNRRGFLLAAESLIGRQMRLRKPASVLMCDLDKFKSINDRFGHEIGDATLRLFGRTARVCTRTTDILGRLGGEEFAAILPGTIDDASVVANRLRGAFEAAGSAVAGCSLDATVSIGIASGLPGTDLKTLLGRADAALYRAKHNGRNRIEVAPEVPKTSDQAPPVSSSQRHVRDDVPKAQQAS